MSQNPDADGSAWYRHIDWDLLHAQTRELTAMLDDHDRDSLVWGVVELLEVMLDDADARGVWRYPRHARPPEDGAKRTNRRTVVINVRGGLVTDVYGAPGIDAVVIDWDTDGCAESDDLLTVRDASGRKLLVNVYSEITRPASDMPVELATAVRMFEHNPHEDTP